MQPREEIKIWVTNIPRNLLLKKRKGKEMILGNFVSLRFERFKDKTKRMIVYFIK